MSERARGLDLVRMPTSVLAAMREAISAERGEVEAAHLLQQAGLQTGAALFEIFRDWLSGAGSGTVEPEDLDPSQFWIRLGEFLDQLGWGTLEAEAMHEGVIAVTTKDWAEGFSSGGGDVCPFTTGMLAEILRRVAGTDIAALEVEADGAAVGRHRILFGGPTVLESVFERIRNGVPHREAIGSLG